MEKKQALQIIKEALDKAIANGSYDKIDTVAIIIQAFQILSKDDKQ